MNRILFLVSSIFISFSLYALTDKQIQLKASEALQVLVSSHTAAFGHDNLYKEPLNLTTWNQAITNMKNLVSTIINETKTITSTNTLGVKDPLLVDALNKIAKAEIDLINAIKASRATLKTPQNSQQIKILIQIKNDMLALQNKLVVKQSNFAKNEAQKLLKSAAMFIEVTADKAIKDSIKR